MRLGEYGRRHYAGPGNVTHRFCRGSTGRTCQLVASTREMRAGNTGSSLGVPPNMRNFVHCVRRLVIWSRGVFYAGTQRVQRMTSTHDPAGNRYATGRNWGTQQNATIYATDATLGTQRFTLVKTAPMRDTGGGRKTLDAFAIDPLMSGDTLKPGRLSQLLGLQQRAGQDGSGSRIRRVRN